jgi:hypothetical protein
MIISVLPTSSVGIPVPPVTTGGQTYFLNAVLVFLIAHFLVYDTLNSTVL